MPSPLSKVVPMRDAKELFGKISQNNHYVVNFSSLNTAITNHIRRKFRVPDARSFVSRKTGILCSEALLPTSGYATAEVKGDFMGIPQQFAHTRLYTDVDFTFYIDDDYKNLRIFEGWMDFISSASGRNENSKTYYRRFQYPDTYKCDTMYITKFERNYKNELVYQFRNVFPKSMTSIPVSYGSAELLKVNVTFNYDRYIVNPGSYSGSNSTAKPIQKLSNDTSNPSNTPVDPPAGSISSDRLRRSLAAVEPFNGSIRQAAEQTGRLDLTRPFGLPVPLA